MPIVYEKKRVIIIEQYVVSLMLILRTFEYDSSNVEYVFMESKRLLALSADALNLSPIRLDRVLCGNGR